MRSLRPQIEEVKTRVKKLFLYPKLQKANTWIQNSWTELKGKGLNHWLVVAILVLGGILIGDLISERKILVGPRLWFYSLLQKADWRSPAYSNQVRTVIIGDEEFWKGELVRRAPLKRKYLAKLIERLDSVHPKAIALDTDLDLQVFDIPVVKDYDDENEKLRQAIEACKSHVVLPRTLIFEGAPVDEPTLLPPKLEEYLVQPPLFPKDDFVPGHVTEGFVSLPYDIRQVPLVVSLKNGTPMDSFAAAIARVVDDGCVESARRNEKDSLPYGTFLSSKGFTELSAKTALQMVPNELEKEIGGKVVLIGGAWHQQSYGQGPQVDLHQTPIGEMGGVTVHANYVDALLRHSTTKPLGEALSLIIEIVLSLVIAVVFAWRLTPLKKLLGAGLVTLASILVAFIFWQNLGLFFDFSIPLILLGAHTAFEKVREWRTGARAYAQLQKEKETLPCVGT